MAKRQRPPVIVPNAMKPGLQWYAKTYPQEAYARMLKVRAELVAEGYPKEAINAIMGKEADKWGLPHPPPLE